MLELKHTGKERTENAKPENKERKKHWKMCRPVLYENQQLPAFISLGSFMSTFLHISTQMPNDIKDCYVY
jgi:hypothetical protein